MNTRNRFLFLNVCIVISSLFFSCKYSANNSSLLLESLSVTDGILSPAFSENIFDYECVLKNGVEYAEILAVPVSSSVYIKYSPSRVLSVRNGISKTAEVKVVSDTGRFLKYKIDFVFENSNTELAQLYLSFISEKGEEVKLFPNENLNTKLRTYSIKIPFSAPVFELYPTAIPKKQKSVVSGIIKSPSFLKKEFGAVQTFSFSVYSESGIADEYVVKAVRQRASSNSKLKDIKISAYNGNSLSDFEIEKMFDEDKNEYYAEIPFTAENIEITPLPEHPCAVIKNFFKTPEYLPSGKDGKQSIGFKIISEDGKSESYYKLKLVRSEKSSNSFLKNISIFSDDEEVPVIPAFSEKFFEYSAEVSFSAEKIFISASSQDAGAHIESIIYTPSVLAFEENALQKITVKVTAEDGSSTEYFVHVKRRVKNNNADLKFLTVNGKNTKEPLTENINTYSIDIPFEQKQVIVRAESICKNAAIKIFPSDTFYLNAGVNEVDIEVTAEDKTKKKYRLNINLLPPEYKMIALKIPKGGIAFPKGVFDEADERVKDTAEQRLEHSFEIANYELTYEQWFETYMWALDKGYIFEKGGQAGSHGTSEIVISLTEPVKPAPLEPQTQYHPVTMMTWRDAIVWCNAKSERENLPPVYYYKGEILRSAVKPVSSSAGGTSLKSANSKNGIILFEGQEPPQEDYAALYAEIKDEGGYRLPTETEWEFAARLSLSKENAVEEKSINLDGVLWYFTKGDSASGAFASCKHVESLSDGTFDLIGRKETDKVAVYKWYFNGVHNEANIKVTGTMSAASKKTNALGLFDMTGNVSEFCWDKDYSIYRGKRGGAWTNGPKNLQLGLHDSAHPNYGNFYTGFRLVRTVK